MARYIALLRGINVGGNVLRMHRLIELFAELGFKDTKTYLQSGNAVFETNVPALKLASTIQKKLIGETRLPVTVIVRTATEWQKTIRSNPFLTEPKMDRSKLHVTFLSTVPSEEGATKLQLIKAGRDRLCILGREVYLHCPDGYGRSKLTNNAIEKCLAISATTRNWNTLTALSEMAAS
jgi:uncharacterized protein (DUF1697 family)